MLTACPLINCRSLVKNLAKSAAGFRPGELHKPCAVRVSLPEGGGFLPTDSICASQVAQTEWIEVIYGLAEATPPSPRGSAAKDSAQGLPKACLRWRCTSFPPFCAFGSAGSRFVARSSRSLCAAWVLCSAVLHVPCRSFCSRRFVNEGSWVPIRTQASDRALQHDCEMESCICVRCCAWLQSMLMLHGSAWVAPSLVVMRVREAAP